MYQAVDFQKKLLTASFQIDMSTFTKFEHFVCVLLSHFVGDDQMMFSKVYHAQYCLMLYFRESRL